MATETKIGFALVVVLVTAFGLVVFQKMNKQKELIAKIDDVKTDETDRVEESPVILGGDIQGDDKPVSLSGDPFAHQSDDENSQADKSDINATTVGLRNERNKPDAVASNQNSQPGKFGPIEPVDEQDDIFRNNDETHQQTKITKSAEATQKSDDFGADLFDTPDQPSEQKTSPANSASGDGVDNPFSETTEKIASNKDDISNLDQLEQQKPTQKMNEKTAQTDDFSSLDEPLPPETKSSSSQQDDPFESQSEPTPQQEEKFGDFVESTLPPKQGGQGIAKQQPFPDDNNFQADEELPPIENNTRVTEDEFDKAFDIQSAEKKYDKNPDHTDERDEVYVVKKNDNYWNISRKVYGRGAFYRALARYNLNRIPNPKKLQPGMKILVPRSEVLAARYPSDCPLVKSSSKAVESGFRLGADGEPVYVIGKDDTLTSIARGHLGRSSRWVQIYQMNRNVIVNPKKLKIGTTLRLPADASRVRLVFQNK